MTQEQKSQIERQGRLCEQALRNAHDAAAGGRIHAVHMHVECAAIFSDEAFRVAQA